MTKTGYITAIIPVILVVAFAGLVIYMRNKKKVAIQGA